jgi:hypothetical protein
MYVLEFGTKRRDVRFRVWDKETKQMFQVNQLLWHPDKKSQKTFGSLVVGHGQHNCLRSIQNYVLMQYTGLKDKNGREIYEGDIVRWDDGTKGELWRVAQVVWDERGQWKYQIIPDQCVNCNPPSDFGLGSFIYTPNCTQYGNVLEVIGNIHQNGDLLNDSKDTEAD